jgi:hypothetical protein
MSAGNLGIVFGPTLLRPLVTFDMSMVALVESTYQGLLVEVLIAQYDRVFGPQPRASTPPPPVPTTPLPETPTRHPCPLVDPETPSTVPDQGGPCRDRPQSLEVNDGVNMSYLLLGDVQQHISIPMIISQGFNFHSNNSNYCNYFNSFSTTITASTFRYVDGKCLRNACMSMYVCVCVCVWLCVFVLVSMHEPE